MTRLTAPAVLSAALCAAPCPLPGMQADASAWDRFFRQKSYVFGTEPIALLKEYVHMFRRGRALDLAMGEGRNAVFLAEQGFEVTGVDFSGVAIEKSLQLAARRGVKIHTIQADLREYRIEPGSYDLITNIYCPQRFLFEQIKAGLKPGGVFVYEQWHPYGWKTRRATGPGRSPNGARPPPGRDESELFQYSDVRLEELATIFSDYQVIVFREAVVDQSAALGGRQGMMLTEVSSLIAKKPFE
jgi:SAM-dependent methyltransferase